MRLHPLLAAAMLPMILAFGSATPAQVTGAIQGSAPKTPMGNVLTGVEKARAPGWLKPGVRLTYLQSACIISGGYSELVPDQNGGIIDRKTGKKFDEVAQHGITANSFLQFDVAAVHDDAVAMDERLITMLDQNGHYIPAVRMGEVTSPGHGGDTWIDPEVLKLQATVRNDAVMIYRHPYKIADTTYNAIFFSVHGQNNWTYAIYDLETGLLLHLATAGAGQAHLEITGPNTMGQDANDKLLSQTTFVSRRQIEVPWSTAPLPAVADSKLIQYAGEQLIDASGVITRIPLAAQLKFHDRAGDIVPITLAIQAYNLGPRSRPTETTVERVVGPVELTPFFIDPASLAKLHQGQEIDNDPTTHYTVSITFMGRDAQGHDVIVLTEAAGRDNPSSQVQFDQTTGLATVLVANTPRLHQRIRLELKSRE